VGKKISIIGGGAWGTALAIVAAKNGHNVSIWSRNDTVVEEINQRHTNSIYLPNAPIPSQVVATRDLQDALKSAALVILVAPSHATRALLTAGAQYFSSEMIVVSATKGIEIDSGKRISQLVLELVPAVTRFVCLSGPSFAEEVAAGHPTAIVAASKDLAAAAQVQTELSFENLRIYTNDDVVGTELGGSIKNVMAIAAGMVSGLGFGANSVAALITRGLAEVSRLAQLEGAQPETMMGLAGLGDLVLTCTGRLSRNRFVGEELGRGRTLAEITAGMHEVAEGVRTTAAVFQLENRLGIEMPITNEVYAVLYEGKSASDATRALMTRPLREESYRRS